jgi:hypothetical protein
MLPAPKFAPISVGEIGEQNLVPLQDIVAEIVEMLLYLRKMVKGEIFSKFYS